MEKHKYAIPIPLLALFKNEVLLASRESDDVNQIFHTDRSIERAPSQAWIKWRALTLSNSQLSGNLDYPSQSLQYRYKPDNLEFALFDNNQTFGRVDVLEMNINKLKKSIVVLPGVDTCEVTREGVSCFILSDQTWKVKERNRPLP